MAEKTLTSWMIFRDRIKRIRQKISRAGWMQAVLSLLISLYIRLVFLTSRVETHCHPAAESWFRGDAPALFAFWHGRLLMMTHIAVKTRPFYALVSNHNDGELIARTVEHFGVHVVRGSSSSGGSSAMRQIVRKVAEGANIGIIPDGPRGPTQVAQGGVAAIARLCQIPVLPVAISATRYRQLNSWDRMQVALPFGRLVICVGEPVLAHDKDQETVRQEVEDALNRVLAEADAKADLATGAKRE